MNRQNFDFIDEARKLFGNLNCSEKDLIILETISKERIGNAYTIWKASGLKHYPTILRILKKLLKRNYVEISGIGLRNDKKYILTLFGELILYLGRKPEEINNFYSKYSKSFSEVLETGVLDGYNLYINIAKQIIYKKNNKESINIVEDEVMDLLLWILDTSCDGMTLNYVESKKTLLELARLKTIKQFIPDVIKRYINIYEICVKELQDVLKNI